MLQPRIIYHLVKVDLWEACKEQRKEYFPPTFHQDGGMIHCTDDGALLLGIGNRFYKEDESEYLLLDIDSLSHRLTGEVRFELPAPVGDKPAAESAHLFPHIYCGLPIEAVVKERKVVRSADGTFTAIEGSTDNSGMVFDVSHVGKRELVDETRAAELLRPLLESSAPIEGLCLSNKSYTLGAAQVIAEALTTVVKSGRMSRLVSVNIADMIAGRPEDEALAVLRTVCEPLAPFKELLSIDVSDNAFGAKGLTACLALLANQSCLKALKACNNGISATAAQQLVDIVLDSTTGAATLELFHFHNNMSGDEGAKALASMLEHAKLSNLKDFRFSGTRAGRQGSLAVATALKSLTKLERLDLIDNAFPDEGSECLAEIVHNCRSTLKVLLLRDSGLEWSGTMTVCDAITAHKPQLTVLDLSGNEIGSEEDERIKAFSAVRKAIASCALTLQVFMCDDNEMTSAGLAPLIAALARCQVLSKLQLSCNELTAKGVMNLAEALKKSNSSLLAVKESVNLDGNFIDEESLESLQSTLGQALGSMEENDPDGADDDDENDTPQNEQDDGELDALIEAISALATPSSSSSMDELKAQAGRKAVDDFVQSGMVVGLGTGSTAKHAVIRIAEKLRSGELKDIVGIPTSESTTQLATKEGIPLAELGSDVSVIDVAIDGADACDRNKQLIKGGGGALLREKLVETAAKKLVIVVDETKPCDQLGPSFALPVEIVQFAYKHTMNTIASLPSVNTASGFPTLRLGSSSNNKVDGDGPAVTDNGNFIVDIVFQAGIADPAALAKELSSVVGVVEHGLFIGMADTIIVARAGGLEVY